MTSILIGRILLTIATLLHTVLYFYGLIVLAAIIVSWLRPNPYSPGVGTLLRIIRTLTEPVFQQVRRRLPAALMRTDLDFSPMIVGLAIMLIEMLVVGSLYDIGHRLRLGAI